jgi:hypothetical protein
MPFRRIVTRLRRAQRPIVRTVTSVILLVTLFLLYYLGFGISRVFMTVFSRRMLYNRPRRRPGRESWWREARGYGLEEASLRRQS